MRDFADKLGDRIGAYRIGFWPGERGRSTSAAYDNPEGFIEVTRENMDTRVSEHFRLRDFLTHDQQDVWPKYLVLRAPLVDKLELVIAQLEARGTRVEHLSVMSGFRTPQYNATGGETGGRAALSRHMYGDAADVFVDNDGDGRMDDLNHDGRINYRDAQVILKAVEQVERAHDDLVGGVGVYRATRSHGPFAHVDVRGSPGTLGEAVSAPEPSGSRLGSIGAALLFGLATIGAVQFFRPDGALTTAPLANLAAAIGPANPAPSASPTADAFGASGEVKVRLTLPGERVEFPNRHRRLR